MKKTKTKSVNYEINYFYDFSNTDFVCVNKNKNN